MASSIYATPPPDLNNEDTALSDVSNNSSSAAVASSSSSVISRTTTTTTPTTTTTTKQQQQQQQKDKLNNTCIGESLEAPLQATTSSSSTSTLLTHSTLQQQHSSLSPYFSASMKCSFLNNANRDDNSYNSSSAYINANVQRNRTNANATDDSGCTTAMAAVAAAANAAMQLQLLEAINEVAQKRSQLSNPHAFPMDRNKTASIATTSLACNEPLGTDKSDSEKLSHKPYVDEEYGLSKIFLPKSFEQLSKAVGFIQPHQQQQVFPDNEHISTEVGAKTSPSPTLSTVKEGAEEEEEEEGQIKISQRRIAYQIYCKECGENFDNEFKLNYHIMQEHNQKERIKNLTTSNSEQTASVQVKQELSEGGTTPTNDVLSSYLANGRNQSPSSSTWLRASLSSLGFPFTATTAGGTYTPLLGLSSGGFATAEGLQRPALRIFNPEAFCELCNKEFCNKYFLKTHKANKHGIFDSTTTDLINSSPTNSLFAMNHLLQMQIQQQQHLELEKSDVLHKNVETTSTTRQLLTSPAAPAPIYCDICSKRFTNIFAMRRHRAKAHEQSPHHTYSSSSSTKEMKTDSYTPPLCLAANENKSNLMEDFRQDFLLEQEEVSFTPQPHKLSPNSQQQARESNFAYDKLKHLGVINPDAFCELCCKEYCNKYFLRTHKWKRHGIFVPPDDNENHNYPKLPVWPFMNMPLNLMTSGGDEKSVLSQRPQDNLEESVQSIKRIKLEIPDEDEEEGKRNADSENSAEKCKNLLGSENTDATVGLQNLQKLQSMIQQLTDFSSGGGKPSTMLSCHICGQGAENHYALQTHLITEHNAISRTQLALQPLQPLQQTMLKESPNRSPGNLATPAGELRCTACNQEFITLSEFHKHIAEIHLLPVMGSEGFITPERPINSNAAAAVVANPRPPYSLTPTSSYCEICNKELCNKYFMKTHMQRMHGIEIENGAQIGGVVCNICNKELCSKYFLRVHKHNTHGIIEEGTPALPHPTRQNGLNLETQSSQTPITETDTVTHRSMSVSPFASGATSRLDSNSSQQEICPLCTKRFRSSKWLRSHLQNDHGSVGGEKLKEMNEDSENAAKTSSPILKTPNGATSSDSPTATTSSSSQLAQALHNLNAQHFLNTTNQTLNFNQQQEQQTLKETPPPPPISRFKEYQCTMCSFTTPYYAFLFIHEKTHSITGNNDPNDPNYNKHNSNIVMQDQVGIEDVNENNPKSKENNTSKILPIFSSSPNIMSTDYDKENENNVKVKSNESNLKAILNDTQSSAVIMNKENKRSVAASPIQSLNQQFMEEVAAKTGQIATYGVPKYHAQHNNANEAAVQMQAFKVESLPESSDNNRFIPAIVYLPVRERLTGTVSITFKLTPA